MKLGGVGTRHMTTGGSAGTAFDVADSHARLAKAFDAMDHVWDSENGLKHSASALPAATPAALTISQYHSVLERAEEGCAQSSMLLGFWHLSFPPTSELPMDRNRAKAIAHLERAARAGDLRAALGVAECYAVRSGDDTNKEVKFVRMAAKGGYAPAQYRLGVFYWEGKGVQPSLRKCRKWLQMAALQKHVEAALSLGELMTSVEWRVLRDGREDPEAVHWLTVAADLGSVRAMGELAQRLLAPHWTRIRGAGGGGGDEGAADDVEATASGWLWLEKASAAGHLPSMYNHALAVEAGEHTYDADPSRALEIMLSMVRRFLPDSDSPPLEAQTAPPLSTFERGALSQAAFRLSDLYTRGAGDVVKRDMEKAVKFGKYAAMMGHVDAAWTYAVWLQFGVKGVMEKDPYQAKKMAESAAARGSSEALEALNNWAELTKSDIEGSTGTEEGAAGMRLPMSMKEDIMAAAKLGDRQAIDLLMQAEEGERSGVTIWVPDHELYGDDEDDDNDDELAQGRMAAGGDQEAHMKNFEFYTEELVNQAQDSWAQEDRLLADAKIKDKLRHDAGFEDDDTDDDDDDDDDEIGVNEDAEDSDYDSSDAEDEAAAWDQASDNDDHVSDHEYDNDDSDDEADKDGLYREARRELRGNPEEVARTEAELMRQLGAASNEELRKLMDGQHF